MRIAWAHFKYALRFVKNQEEMARVDSLARDLSDKDVDGFWKTVRKMNNCNTIYTCQCDRWCNWTRNCREHCITLELTTF